MHLKRCNMKKFDEIIEKKTIACYGIGKEFDIIIKNYCNYKWVNKIRYLIDGDSNLQGLEKKIGKENLVIGSIKALRNTDLKNIIIIPTCSSFCEVIEFLNGIEWLNDVDCFVFHCMFNLSEGKLENIRQSTIPLIPATIHYCWFGRKTLPDVYKENINTWRKYCPDYNIIEWNENNCNIKETAFTTEAYERGKFGFVPDYFRLKIIYEYGGIYLDTDVRLIKSLDDLRYNKSFCGIEFPGRVALGLGFGSVKRNSIFQKMMEYYQHTHFIFPDGKENIIPSPVIQSEMLEKIGLENGVHLRSVKELTVCPVDVLSPKNPYTGEICITENTYALHNFDGTWLSNKENDIKCKHLNEAKDLLSQIEAI